LDFCVAANQLEAFMNAEQPKGLFFKRVRAVLVDIETRATVTDCDRHLPGVRPPHFNHGLRTKSSID
jgi:hypothetical protein